MGAPICPDCNKFCSLDTEEPSIEQYDADFLDDHEAKETTIHITAEILVTRLSACCGTEVKSYSFDVEGEFTIEGHFGEGHALEFDEGDIELIEESGGRYQKSYYGYRWIPTITCSCGKDVKTAEEMVLEDKIAASEFEELC